MLLVRIDDYDCDWRRWWWWWRWWFWWSWRFQFHNVDSQCAILKVQYFLVLTHRPIPRLRESFFHDKMTKSRKWKNVDVSVCIYFPPVQLMSSYFQTIFNFIGNLEEKWPQNRDVGHSNQTTTMFGHWQPITYFDANQTQYLQFLDRHGLSDWF